MSVFPSTGLWLCLAAIALLDAALIAAGGFHLVSGPALLIAATCTGAAGLGWIYTRLRPDARLSALGFGAAYLIAYTLLAAVLSYLGTSADFPLLDARFAAADAALGLDWMRTLEACTDWPWLGRTLRLAYESSMLQMVAVFLILAGTGQLTRLAHFLALFVTTSLVIVALSCVLPAAGAFVHYDPPAALRAVVGRDAGLWHLAHFEGLRSGTLKVIDPANLQGLITFPSFHTALAVITTWAFWRTRYVASAAILLNGLVIASTVPVGGHYFVDVAAGFAIAAASIAVVTWRRSPLWRGAWAASPATS